MLLADGIEAYVCKDVRNKISHLLNFNNMPSRVVGPRNHAHWRTWQIRLNDCAAGYEKVCHQGSRYGLFPNYYKITCSGENSGKMNGKPATYEIFTTQRLAKRGICRRRVSVCVCVFVTLRYCIYQNG